MIMVNPLPKPKYSKIRKHKFPPLFDLGFCWGCHWKFSEYNYRNLSRHHLYQGNPDRSHSEQYGLYVDLCGFGSVDCHLSVTDEKDQKLITYLQQEGQRRFEAVYGKGEFERIFGRNYL